MYFVHPLHTGAGATCDHVASVPVMFQIEAEKAIVAIRNLNMMIKEVVFQ